MSLDDGPKALKVIWKDELTEESMDLLKSECGILSSLAVGSLQKEALPHPGIVQLHALYETPADFCLLQDLLDGKELYDVVVERGRLAEHEAGSILQQVSSAVEYLHGKDIVHRDLKPENIMILYAAGGRRGGTEIEAKLTDFGLATRVPPAGSSEGGGLIRTQSLTQKCGSVPYMAPEVLGGRGYGPECDLWSMGVVLYVMLCGSLPFYQPPPLLYEDIQQGRYTFHQKVWEGVSPDAVELISQCLETDPAQRLRPQGVLLHRWIQGQLATVEDDDLGELAGGSSLKGSTAAAWDPEGCCADNLKGEHAESPPSPCSLKAATESLRRSSAPATSYSLGV